MLLSNLLLLAQEDTERELPGTLDEGVEVLVDLLPVPERTAWFIEAVLGPGLAIVLVLFLAGVLSRLAKRGIRRGVARMKAPASASRGRSEEVAEAVIDNLRRQQRADALGHLANSLVSVVVWSMAFILVLAQVGLNLGPLIAGAGIVGVAVGFGAQDLVKDFLSGVFMLIEDQYGVGDVVDVGEATGVVEGITLRSTRLRAVDGTLWHIPNGEIRKVGNKTQEFSQVVLDIGVGYEADIDESIALIGQVASELATEAGWADVVLESPQVLGVEALSDDSVDIRLLVKTLPMRQWEVARELRRRLKYALDAENIEIPLPQQVVYLRTEAPLVIGRPEVTADEQSQR